MERETNSRRQLTFDLLVCAFFTTPSVNKVAGGMNCVIPSNKIFKRCRVRQKFSIFLGQPFQIRIYTNHHLRVGRKGWKSCLDILGYCLPQEASYPLAPQQAISHKLILKLFCL